MPGWLAGHHTEHGWGLTPLSLDGEAGSQGNSALGGVVGSCRTGVEPQSRSSVEKSWPFLFGGGCQGSSGYASWGICSLCLGPVTMAAPVCFHVTMCYILNKFLTALYQVLIEDYCYLDKDSCTLPLPRTDDVCLKH